MKQFFSFCLILLYSFSLSQHKYQENFKLDSLIEENICSQNLTNGIYTLANDSMQGRKAGAIGEKLARKYLTYQFKNIGLKRDPRHLKFEQKIDTYHSSKVSKYSYNGVPNIKMSVIENSYNIIGTLIGKDTINYESIVVGAHYDHIGLNKNKKVYNGADDNASGTIAVIELAKLFKELTKNGYKPKRSITFALFSAEEDGLIGSAFYIFQPVLPLNKVATMINMDMIGRIDRRHKKELNYIYAIGTDRIYSRLKQICNDATKSSEIVLDFKYDKNDNSNTFMRSDHYNFHKVGIPVVQFFSGTHKDYHKISDTADKIEYDILEKRIEYIARLLWKLSNDDELIKGNKVDEYIKNGKITTN